MTSHTHWQSKIHANLKQLPKTLQDEVSTHIEAFITAHKNANLPELKNTDIIDTLCKVWACSNFVARNCIKYPFLINQLEESKAGGGLGDAGKYKEILTSELQAIQDLTEIAARLC